MLMRCQYSDIFLRIYSKIKMYLRNSNCHRSFQCNKWLSETELAHFQSLVIHYAFNRIIERTIAWRKIETKHFSWILIVWWFSNVSMAANVPVQFWDTRKFKMIELKIDDHNYRESETLNHVIRMFDKPQKDWKSYYSLLA